ncbi:MAG: UDP-2,3-diacylglucosamine diphosphatase [Bernardetiaceae bacterium]|jgi:UDP-2,3-diacylglucosamine pyrophosphatase LpxH|nr:UDP-2,3-diacylglucosamine diphosphatase [Bernardetiaceae bacterium]
MDKPRSKKRRPEVVVISDTHLGTYGCQAKELLQYLKTIKPKVLILNGDIIDIWQFSKRYFPKSHFEVIRRIFKMMANGTMVYYLTGNHDELLRRLPRIDAGNFKLQNRLVLNLDGKKHWIFHGDVFDVSMQYAKWLAKLGAIGYDTLILLNAGINWLSEKLGYNKIPLSKQVKASVKSAVKFINDFEQIAAELAIEKKYDYFICGHIHQPAMKKIITPIGEVNYLNSGDWIENLTALEYENGQWRLYQHGQPVPEVRVAPVEPVTEENLPLIAVA